MLLPLLIFLLFFFKTIGIVPDTVFPISFKSIITLFFGILGSELQSAGCYNNEHTKPFQNVKKKKPKNLLNPLVHAAD